MMAMSDGAREARPVSLKSALLSVLLSAVLVLVALFGLVRVNAVVKVLIATGTLLGPWAWQTMLVLGTGLLMCTVPVAAVLWLKPWKAIAAISDEPRDEDGPENFKPAIISGLLAFLALAGLAAAAGVVSAVFHDPRIKHPVNWLTWAHVATFLLIGLGALWGVIRLKPWARREQLSPSMRRTNALFGLSGLIATASCLAVIFGTQSKGNHFTPFTNAPLTLWVALFAIITWIVSWVVAWWWYASADEHEQRASDVGLLFGGFLFAVVTPVWWVAARAGLAPQPNAMILWLGLNMIWTIGWMWRRNR